MPKTQAALAAEEKQATKIGSGLGLSKNTVGEGVLTRSKSRILEAQSKSQALG